MDMRLPFCLRAVTAASKSDISNSRVLSSADLTLYSPLAINRRNLCLPSAYTLVSCSAYSSTLHMEAICSSETSDDFQRNISEDPTLFKLVSKHTYNAIEVVG
jgi:hypothetical protein